jgi:phosphate transport system substrate-binding protein
MDEAVTQGRDHFAMRRLIARAAILLAAMLAFSSAFADTLVIQGSTTFNRRVIEKHQAAIEAASGQHLTVIPNKSTPGLVALFAGRAQMAMISAPLANELEELKKVTPDCACERLRAFEVMSTRIAIGVHPSNPVRRASLETIRRILNGEIRNWRELGGPDRPIRVALAAGGGILAVVETALLDGHATALPNTLYINTPVQLVQVMEQEPGVLGFAQLTLVQQRGIPEIVTDRPLETTLNFVTLGEPTPAMRAVIDAARRIANSAM